MDECNCHIKPPCDYCVEHCSECGELHDECVCEKDDGVGTPRLDWPHR